MEKRRVLVIAAFLGALAVGLGAFGAHALKPFLLENDRLATYETAVQYHFYHTFLLLIIGLIQFRFGHKFIRWSALCILLGIVLFSGSLYMLCFSGSAIWGPVTPLGGVFLILGWAFLGFGLALNKKDTEDTSEL